VDSPSFKRLRPAGSLRNADVNDRLERLNDYIAACLRPEKSAARASRPAPA
jgi:hypothetical protein